MRILILGGDGMMGHRLFLHLCPRHDVRVTLRQPLTAYKEYGLFNDTNAFAGIDVRSLECLARVFAEFRPETVVNCAGIVKQRIEAEGIILSLEINSLLPHRLSVLCKATGARLIHLSTDCVFSGKRGMYTEKDPSDAEDLYGRSKFLGEVSDAHCLTLRTSIIGRELSRKTGLLEWFLSQKGTVRGFRNAIFSGFTTHEMSRVIEKMLVEYPNASGVYNVSSEPISKFDLLLLIKETLGLAIEVIPYESFRCDRSLNSERFRREFLYTPPSWKAMIEEMCYDMQKESINDF